MRSLLSLREGKCYSLVIQRQRRTNGDLDLWEGEYTYRCILTNNHKSSTRDIVEFYNKRGGKERIFDEMNWISFKHLTAIAISLGDYLRI